MVSVIFIGFDLVFIGFLLLLVLLLTPLLSLFLARFIARKEVSTSDSAGGGSADQLIEESPQAQESLIRHFK